MSKQKLTQSQIDGVQYRRAKLWQIILISCNALVGMSVYSLIGMASYSASIGYGVSTAIVGIIITCANIFDGFTDPIMAFIYDKVNTKFGRLRVLLIVGYVIQAVTLLAMFDLMSSKGGNWVVFTLLYFVWVIGYTVDNMTAQTFAPIITNDPKQRPTVGVWSTAFNYLVPMVLSIVFSVVLLPMFGGTYNQAFLSAAARLSVIVAGVGIVLVCIGITPYDKPEYYNGVGKQKPLKFKDMLDIMKSNKPLQCYIAAAASDKIAQITASQTVVATMLYTVSSLGTLVLEPSLAWFP